MKYRLSIMLRIITDPRMNKSTQLSVPPHLHAFIFLLIHLMLLLCSTTFQNQYTVHFQDEIFFIISIFTSFTSQFSPMSIKGSLLKWCCWHREKNKNKNTSLIATMQVPLMSLPNQKALQGASRNVPSVTGRPVTGPLRKVTMFECCHLHLEPGKATDLSL